MFVRTYLIAGTTDGKIFLWDYETGLCKEIRRPPPGSDEAQSVAAASAGAHQRDGTTAAAASGSTNADVGDNEGKAAPHTTPRLSPTGIVGRHRRRRIIRKYQVPYVSQPVQASAVWCVGGN